MRKIVLLIFLAVFLQKTGAAVTTNSGFQSALDAVARAEPNAPQGEVPNRSSPIQAQGIIPIAKPLNWPGNGVAEGVGNGATLAYLGTDVPIYFYSAVNSTTSGVSMDRINIWAPFARATYDWNRARHPGNAHDYAFRNARWTAAGTHFNCRAPGDGRFYWPVFENISCYGTGSMVNGTPVGGWFFRCFYVNGHCNNDYIIDLEPTPNGYGGEASFIKCWINPAPKADGSATGVFRSVGAFWAVEWKSYLEPAGWFDKPMWTQDGLQNEVTTPGIYFASPSRYVQLKNGAILTFTGQTPKTQTDGGWNVDLNLPMDAQTLAWAVDIIRHTFVFGDNQSYVGFGSGKVNAAGVIKPVEAQR
jgi:hypothetical protein